LPLTDAEAAFRQAYPESASTRRLDELRATEYARLDRTGHVYLDYTGGGLYAESQVRAHLDLLLRGVFGNPHSTNPTSLATTFGDVYRLMQFAQRLVDKSAQEIEAIARREMGVAK
jgi:selenocysteine lyase/cysteine desulfurase